MTTERPPRDAEPTAPVVDSAANRTRLRRRVRVVLERHLDHIDHRQRLQVIGLHQHGSALLDRADESPEQLIIGLTLPARYWAIVVVAPSVVTTRPWRRHDEASLAVGVSRSGDIVSFVATDADGVIDTHHPTGWLVDACLRAVGRATAPCSAEPLDLFLALWLDRLMTRILGGSDVDGPITWAQAVDLCPTPRRWMSADPVELGSTLGSTVSSWAAMRRAAAHGRRSPVGIEPRHARWMDDAMFARWCLGYFPDLANLRADVEFLAPPRVADNVELVVQAARSATAQ